MFSKFLSTVNRLRPSLLALRDRPKVSRSSSDYLPLTQYDIPLPRRLNLMYVLRVYWETTPLFLVTTTSLSICIFSIFWAIQHKVDVVYTTHNRDCPSRTMDLRNPEVHKIFIINQRYEPWPEMQDVLDKMKTAQKRALVRAQSCQHA